MMDRPNDWLMRVEHARRIGILDDFWRLVAVAIGCLSLLLLI